MPLHSRLKTVQITVAAAACSMALTVGVSPAAAAPPALDSQGYVNSTARCAAPAQLVAFGSTNASRVAICKTASGKLEYRGVRVRDGARLILPASESGTGTFVADNDGVTYTVTSNSLEVSSGTRVLRKEAMLDFHGPATTEQPGTTSPAPTNTDQTDSTQTESTPDTPPLPAEVGGSGG